MYNNDRYVIVTVLVQLLVAACDCGDTCTYVQLSMLRTRYVCNGRGHVRNYNISWTIIDTHI